MPSMPSICAPTATKTTNSPRTIARAKQESEAAKRKCGNLKRKCCNLKRKCCNLKNKCGNFYQEKNSSSHKFIT